MTVFRAKLHPEIRHAMETVSGQLAELGHTITQADPSYGLRMSWSLLSRSTSGLLDWADRRGGGGGGGDRRRPLHSRRRWPTTSTTGAGLATDRTMIRACPLTWPWNLLGSPSINVPAGFTSGGLPIGVQLMGPANSEPLLISLAAELEALNGWAARQSAIWWNSPVEQPVAD